MRADDPERARVQRAVGLRPIRAERVSASATLLRGKRGNIPDGTSVAHGHAFWPYHRLHGQNSKVGVMSGLATIQKLVGKPASMSAKA